MKTKRKACIVKELGRRDGLDASSLLLKVGATDKTIDRPWDLFHRQPLLLNQNPMSSRAKVTHRLGWARPVGTPQAALHGHRALCILLIEMIALLTPGWELTPGPPHAGLLQKEGEAP